MAYSREVYEKAKFLLDSYHRQAVGENDERRKAFIAANPEYGELEREIARTAIRLTRVMLSGQKDISETVTEIREGNLAMQRRQLDILRANGCPDDYLEPKFHCEKCRDTGFIDGRMCGCF